MVHFKMHIALLLVVAALISNQQSIECNDIESRLNGIAQLSAELRQDFGNKVGTLFYESKEVAEERQNWPLLSLSAQVAEVEAIIYAMQLRGLAIAQEIIDSFFLKRTRPLTEVLANRNENLADMIIQSVIIQSIRNAFNGVEMRRKKVYLQLLRFEDVPGVKRLASKYSQCVIDAKSKETVAGEAYQASFEKYRFEAPLMLSEEHAAATDRAIKHLIQEVVMQIDLAQGSTTAGAGIDVEDLLYLYIDQTFVDDFRLARMIAYDKVDRLDLTLVERVDMHDVLAYEDGLNRASKDIGVFVEQVNSRLEDLEAIFHEAFQELFTLRQEEAANATDFRLMATSAEAAQAEAQIYVNERRMLLILADLLVRYPEPVKTLFEDNTKLIELLIKRLVNYAHEHALRAAEPSRKKTFLLMRRYDQVPSVGGLSIDYCRRMKSRREQVANNKEDIQRATEEYMIETPHEKATEMLDFLRDLLLVVTNLWTNESVDFRAFRYFMPSEYITGIQGARRRSKGSVHRVGPVQIIRCSISAVERFEDRLGT